MLSPLLCLCKRCMSKARYGEQMFFRRSGVIKKKKKKKSHHSYVSPVLSNSRVELHSNHGLLELWAGVSFLRKRSSYGHRMCSVSCALNLVPNSSFVCKICSLLKCRDLFPVKEGLLRVVCRAASVSWRTGNGSWWCVLWSSTRTRTWGRGWSTPACVERADVWWEHSSVYPSFFRRLL